MVTTASTQKRIKICNVLAKLETGGMENGVVNLCNRLNRVQFEPIICCMKEAGSMAERLKPDVRLICLNYPEGKSVFRPVRLAKFFIREKPDIIHLRGWGAGLYDGVLGAKLAGVPYILNSEHGTFFLKPLQIVLQKILLRMCHRILTVSEILKERVSDLFRISKHRITVVPNGVDTDRFTGLIDPHEMITRFHEDGIIIKDDDFIIGYVGSLRPVKNIGMLLEAVRMIFDKNLIPNLQVILVGDGPERNNLKTYSRRHHLEDRVFFLGNRSELHRIYPVFHTVVLCSHSEGMSNILLESMASGVPVICTVGSDRKNEIVKDNFNGFQIENNDVAALADAIVKMRNDSTRKLLSHNAINFIREHYSVDIMVKRYEKVYRSLFPNE